MANRRTRRRTHPKSKPRTTRKTTRTRRGLTQAQTNLLSKVKRANQRLRELEKNNLQTPAYNFIKALYESQSMITNTTKKGEIKLRTDIAKLSEEQQADLEKTVKDFLQAKTSTVKGMRKYFESATDSYNERYGTDYGTDEVANAISNMNFKELVNMFGSKEAVKILKEGEFADMSEEEQADFIKEHGEQLQDYINDYKPTNKGTWENNDWRSHGSKYGLNPTGKIEW